jgi:membrane protein involved in D-alanine export
MTLHNTLPFSSTLFFYFMAIAIGIVWVGKFLLKERIPYNWLIAFISTGYLVILFPKPLQLVGLIVYLYLAVLALKKWYSSENIVFPMLILSVPIFLMKSYILIPEETASDSTRIIKNIIQIAGLSYIVFKVIGLYLDERRNKVNVSFLSFFNCTAFVPTLLIGPIDRYKRFNTDVESGYKNINRSFYIKGWNNFILGLLFKFILAEAIHRLVLSQLIDDGSMQYHVSYMYTYLLYLFFDFAGYSLLAIAFGNFLGVDVPINFDKPFLAINPKEFWKRWHKTLGDWLGDYFFKPIFKYLTTKGVFKSHQRQNIALFLTFTLMGFWNGFELHFIVSGMLFGFYSVVHNYYIYRCKMTKTDVFFGNMNPKLVRVLSILILFNLVAFAIYIFSGNLF